jgi:hypothetical protein
MIGHKSSRLYATPPTLQARLEIVKAIRNLLREDHVTKASADDAEHPGWPAGSPDGQGGKFRPKDNGATVLAGRRISPELLEECEEQYKRDLFQCRMVGLPECYQQALLRRTNCERGLQIPPLNY